MAGKDKVKFGFVGTGRRGLNHLRTIKTFEEASVEALCDVSESNLEKACSEVDARTYVNLDDMLANESLDAVVISTPTVFHVPQTIKCLENGLHVLLEKPVALSMDEVNRLFDVVERSSSIVMVGFQTRYSDVAERIRENVDKDTLSMIAGYWYWTIPLVRWIARRNKGGGQMVDQTIHLIDLARYIAGEAETVYAEYTQRGRHTAEDRASGFDNWASYAVTIRFKNGVIGNLYSTYALYPDVFRSTAESVESDKATRESSVILDVICRELLIRYVHARETRVYRKGEEIKVYRRKDDPTRKMHKAFIAAIQTGDKSLVRTPYEDSYKTMAVSLGATRSSITHMPVNLDTFMKH